MKLQTYQFVIKNRLTRKDGQYRVEGSVEELSIQNAYRKVSGDHAAILVVPGMTLFITDPNAKTVKFITEAVEE